MEPLAGPEGETRPVGQKASIFQLLLGGEPLGRIKHNAGLLLGGNGIAGLAWLGLAWLGPTAGPMMGIALDHHSAAFAYCLVVILAHTATPIGLLRLFDRYAIVAWSRPLTPALRLLGCLFAWLAGAGFAVFAAIWALAAAVEATLLWHLAARTLGRGGWLEGFTWRLSGLALPHPGLWHMVLWTNLQGSLGLVSGRLATLLVGSLLGPAAAGLCLVGHQAAMVIERPLQLAKRAIDPEFARLIATSDHATLSAVHNRTRLWTAARVLLGASTAALLAAARQLTPVERTTRLRLRQPAPAEPALA